MKLIADVLFLIGSVMFFIGTGINFFLDYAK